MADEIIENLNVYIKDGKQAEFTKIMKAIVENARQEAFMDGYKYAIALLQESLVKIPGE